MASCGSSTTKKTWNANVSTSEASSPREQQGVVGYLSRLAHSGLPAEEFYGRFLDAIPIPPGTLGTVAWVCSEDSFSKIAAGSKSLTDSVQLPVSASEHAAQLHEVRKTAQAMLFEPPAPSGYQVIVENALPNIVVFPVIVADSVPVIVEAYLPPDLSEDRTQQFIRQTQLLCEIAGNFHQSTNTPGKMGGGLGLSPAVHESLRIHDTCFAIANEGRRAIGCDRVTTMLRRGNKYRVQAVSGQDTINPRANLVQFLQRLVNRVMRTGEPFWYPEDAEKLPPEIEHDLEAYLEVSLTRYLAILPLQVSDVEKEKDKEVDEHALQRSHQSVGAIVVEQFTELVDSQGVFRHRISEVAREGSVALRNAVDHDSIFLLPLWRWIGGMTRYFRGSLLPKTVAVLSGLLLAILALIFVQAEMKVSCDGRLMPVVRRNLYAQFEGTVDDLQVEHGSEVEQGQQLATLRNHELDLAMERTRGEIRKAQSQLEAALVQRFSNDPSASGRREKHAAAAQEKDLKVLLKSLADQQAILEKRKSKLSVVSKIDGSVITWNLKERLQDRPVQRGQLLMEVAQLDGAWGLELNLPDRRIAEVLAASQQSESALKVTYILASDNSEKYEGQVTEIEKSTRIDAENGQTILVHVEINKEEIPFLQPGTQIQAKIHCGKRRLGYVWLRDVWHFIKSTIVFPLT